MIGASSQDIRGGRGAFRLTRELRAAGHDRILTTPCCFEPVEG